MKTLALSAPAIALLLTTTYAVDKGLDLPVTPEKPERTLRPGERPEKPPEAPAAPVEEDLGATPTFYGSEIKSPNSTVYFVIDVSGSMGIDLAQFMDGEGNVQVGDRLDRAKAELSRAIRRLPENFRFNLLAYDCSSYVWRPDLEKAEPDQKVAAIAWVMALKPGGGTGTGDAVALALGCRENMLVVLLTDGDPNCNLGSANGSCQDPAEHRRTIKSANLQSARVDVFGICAVGQFRQFCRDVASDNNGTYTEVQ